MRIGGGPSYTRGGARSHGHRTRLSRSRACPRRNRGRGHGVYAAVGVTSGVAGSGVPTTTGLPPGTLRTGVGTMGREPWFPSPWPRALCLSVSLSLCVCLCCYRVALERVPVSSESSLCFVFRLGAVFTSPPSPVDISLFRWKLQQLTRCSASFQANLLTMSHSTSVSAAVPVLSNLSTLARGSCIRQRIEIRGHGAFRSLQNMTCNSGKCRGQNQFRSSWARKTLGMTRILASQEGVPQEILEDSKFVPINEDDPRFGPPAMLLLGFRDDEVATALQMLKDMGGDFMQVLLCTKEMMDGTLNEALNTVQPDLSEVEVVQGLQPICFLSGLSGEELMMVVRAFPEVGLTGTAFAAHVPKNSNKPMRELVEEIMGDHERLSKPRQPVQP